MDLDHILNSSDETFYPDLTGFTDELPFPLSQSWQFQMVILILMVIVFCYGLKLRILIIRYLMSPECKGPINVLIWADQLNGIFLALGILLKMVFLVSPVPLAKVLGDGFCRWAGVPISLYVTGAGSWSWAIAAFRVIIIKGTTLLKDGTVLKVVYLMSIAIHLGCGILMAKDGEITAPVKLCFHHTESENEIMELYKDLSASQKQKSVSFLISAIAIFLTVTEFSSYFIFFLHVRHHNNSIASAVLSPTTIRQRNRTNAISMVGLFMTWFLEVCYITVTGIVVTVYRQEWFREYSAILRDFDFVLIPLILIITSPPIKQFKLKIPESDRHID